MVVKSFALFSQGVKLEYENNPVFVFSFGVLMTFNTSRHFNDFSISYDQKVKIQKRLTFGQARAFHNAVKLYNTLTPEAQYAGDGINGGQDGYRVDISVDPRRPVIHVEIDALGENPKFFRCDIEGDIVIQELAL